MFCELMFFFFLALLLPLLALCEEKKNQWGKYDLRGSKKKKKKICQTLKNH